MLQKLIAGNWKMNGSLAANQALLADLLAGLAAQAPACQVAVAVPAPYLAQVQQLHRRFGHCPGGAGRFPARQRGLYR